LILIVDLRDCVLSAYASGFQREGVATISFVPDDFALWLRSASRADVHAVEIFLVGMGPGSEALPETIKQRSAAPVIALIDNRKLETTLQLFAAGADDVVEKPVHVREILARASAIRRRSVQRAESTIGDIRIFADGRDPVIGGTAMQLPRRERRILEYLANNSERWVERDQIFAAIYGACEDEVANTTVECHLSKLRRKLRSRLGYDPIQCRRFVGYKFSQREGRGRTINGRAAGPKLQASVGQVSLSL